MTDQKNDDATNDDLLGAEPQAPETPSAPETQAAVDNRPPVIGDPTDEPDDLPVRENPLPDAPVIDGKMVGDHDYPYDMVMSEMNREAGQLERHAAHLKKVSAYVLRYKAKFAKRMTLAELNRKTRENTQAIDNDRAQVRERIMQLMAEAGMAQQ